MKTSELFEAKAPKEKPSYDPKTGYVKGRNTHSKEDIADAISLVKKTPAYKRILKVADLISTKDQLDNGTLVFVRQEDKKKGTHEPRHYSVHVTGQLRSSGMSVPGHGGAPERFQWRMKSPEPLDSTISHRNSVLMTMAQALDHLADHLEKNTDAEKTKRARLKDLTIEQVQKAIEEGEGMRFFRVDKAKFKNMTASGKAIYRVTLTDTAPDGPRDTDAANVYLGYENDRLVGHF